MSCMNNAVFYTAGVIKAQHDILCGTLVPLMQQVENHVFKPVAGKIYLASHNPPHIEQVAANNAEDSCFSVSPRI